MAAATRTFSLTSMSEVPDALVSPSVAAADVIPVPASTATAAMATANFAMIASTF